MGNSRISTSTALALAAVLLSSSTAAFVVAKVPKHSVGALQLKASAVTNSKIAKKAVTASKVKPNSLGGTQIKESSLGVVPNAGFATSSGNTARLQNKAAADFVGATRMAFGKGNGMSTTVDTVLSLTNVGVTVSTVGSGLAADATRVSVTVPMESSPAPDWYFSASNANTFSTNGGTQSFGVADLGAVHDVTVHIWRNSGTAGIYLHCSFDTSGFSTSKPFSCWAFSTGG